MWIVSQDKFMMMNADNTSLITINKEDDKEYSICFFDSIGKWHHYLGRYVELDNAMQVMQKICEAIKGTMKDPNGHPLSENIFYMPLDE